MQTDAGITGWGAGFGHTIIPATKAALESYVAPWFIGKDPSPIAALHREAAEAFHIFGRNGPVRYARPGIYIDLWDIAGKRAGVATHIAAGVHAFRDMFELGAIDIAQPSMTKIGGITEMRKIIALAEAHSVELLSHCAYFGPDNLASIHIVASLATDTLLERLNVNLSDNPVGDSMTVANGLVVVPQGPGLGVEPDMRVVERYRPGDTVTIC